MALPQPSWRGARMRRAAERHDPAADLELAEAHVVGGHHDVAGERELDGQREGDALHGHDDRLGHRRRRTGRTGRSGGPRTAPAGRRASTAGSTCARSRPALKWSPWPKTTPTRASESASCSYASPTSRMTCRSQALRLAARSTPMSRRSPSVSTVTRRVMRPPCQSCGRCSRTVRVEVTRRTVTHVAPVRPRPARQRSRHVAGAGPAAGPGRPGRCPGRAARAEPPRGRRSPCRHRRRARTSPSTASTWPAAATPCRPAAAGSSAPPTASPRPPTVRRRPSRSTCRPPTSAATCCTARRPTSWP